MTSTQRRRVGRTLRTISRLIHALVYEEIPTYECDGCAGICTGEPAWRTASGLCCCPDCADELSEASWTLDEDDLGEEAWRYDGLHCDACNPPHCDCRENTCAARMLA
jgi:hypothetical protein